MGLCRRLAGLQDRSLLDPLEDFGELHRQINAFADLLDALRIGFAIAQPLELAEQQLEIARNEPMPEFGIDARARKVVVGHERDCAHLHSRVARPLRA
jgi:hypothetical protein